MLVACSPMVDPLAALPAVALVTVLASIVCKSFMSKWIAPPPAAGRTLLLTFAEPVLYPAFGLGALALAEVAWGWEPQLLHGAVGLAVAFVAIAGLHGRFLGHTNPDIAEDRRLGLAILYSLPIPATTVALSALVVAYATI